MKVKLMWRCNMAILRMNTTMIIWFTWRWSGGTETCNERIKENKEKIVGCDCGLYVYIHCMYCMSVLNIYATVCTLQGSSQYKPIVTKIHSIFSLIHVLVFVTVSFLLLSLPILYKQSSYPHPCYMACTSHPPWSIIPITPGEEYISLRSSLHHPVTTSLFGPNVLISVS
jgi:hypothetical protein